VGLQFACLVTFSWMRSERVIQRLWCGFHEPEKSHAHTEMVLHGYFHESTVERSVARTFFLAFSLLLIVLAMQHSRGEAHALKKSCTCHPRFPTHFCWPFGPYLARLEDPMPWEHSMRFRYFFREFKAQKNQVRSNSAFHASISAQWHLERCKPACPHFYFFSMQWPGSESPLSPRKVLL
jgi:hypothetical protein